MTTPISSLSLSLRASNALADAGIETCESIAEMGYKRLLQVPHMGPTCVREIWPQVQHLSKRMINVRVRLVVYREAEPDTYGYLVDIGTSLEVGDGSYAVWIEANVPAEPPAVQAKVVPE